MPFGMGPLGWAFVPYWSPWGMPYTWAVMPKEQEIRILEDQARALEQDLEIIKERLEELRK